MGCDEIEWNEVITNEILMFGFVNNEWNGMEHDGIHLILKYQLPNKGFRMVYGD